MAMNPPKTLLSALLAEKEFPQENNSDSAEELEHLHLAMLRIQQGIWHSGRRAIVAFEGFDAAGKGGSIRNLVKTLDPRGTRVHAIGPPSPEERERHYLFRFWAALPPAGIIAIFDRSWYGRVLVERVEKLTPKYRWQAAYEEINHFEIQLVNDGIDVVKIFLAIHPEEQLRRFEERLRDPYKQWKLTNDDIKSQKKWHQYVQAADDMLCLTNTKPAPWHVIPADSKPHTHGQVLKIVTSTLKQHSDWLHEMAIEHEHAKTLKHDLKLIREAQKKYAK